MSISLALQSTYQSVEIGLFSDGKMIACAQEQKNDASKNSISTIGSLLATHNINLSDVDYFAVNQGPGPYTTLRVVIATVNGLAYATQKPIIGIDAFSTLITEAQTPTHSVCILFDAFNKDVYYAQADSKKITTSGCIAIVALATIIPPENTSSLTFIGNGCLLYRDQLTSLYPHSHSMLDIAYPSLQALGAAAHALWLTGESLKQQISPLYLKEQKYKNQMGVMTAI